MKEANKSFLGFLRSFRYAELCEDALSTWHIVLLKSISTQAQSDRGTNPDCEIADETKEDTLNDRILEHHLWICRCQTLAGWTRLRAFVLSDCRSLGGILPSDRAGCRTCTIAGLPATPYSRHPSSASALGSKQAVTPTLLSYSFTPLKLPSSCNAT